MKTPWAMGVMWFLGISFGLAGTLAAQSSGTTIYACVNASSGEAKIVSASTICGKHFTKISWNTAGQPGPPGPALVVNDSNGVLVGPVVEVGSTGDVGVAVKLGSSFVLLPMNDAGFETGGPLLLFTSSVCAGTAYTIAGQGYLLGRGVVKDGVAFIPSGPASIQTIAAALIVKTQADCALFPINTFFPPDQCCVPGIASGQQSVAPMASFDLANLGLVPPFKLTSP